MRLTKALSPTACHSASPHGKLLLKQSVRTKMKEKSTLVIAPLLVTTSLIPPGMYVYQFVNNGGLGWLLIWGNELVVWCAIFSLLSIAGLVDAIKKRSTNPKSGLVVCIVALCVITYSFVGLVSPGVTAASKADDNTLKLLEFWSSGWWK